MPTPLSNSHHTDLENAAAGFQRVGPLSAAALAETAEVTLQLRETDRGKSLDEVNQALSLQAPKARAYLGIDDMERDHGYTKSDEDAVRRWATAHGLQVVGEDPATRRLRVRGTVEELGQAFSVNLEQYRQVRPDGTVRADYRDHAGPASLDPAIAGRVTNILGLNTRPVASTKYIVLGQPAPPTAVSYNPEQVAAFYGFPALPNGGEGLTINIGIAELGGMVNQADLATIKSQIGDFTLTETAIDGATIVSDPTGADGEVALDWQVIARVIKALAPKATLNINVKYGPNTNQGFADVLAAFASDGVDYASVSTSWGGPKNTYAAGDLTAIHSSIQQILARGAVATFAAGDSGFLDGTKSAITDYPSSDVASLSIGGTSVVGDTATNTITNEFVWNELSINEGASGGGVDPTQPVPSYQSANGVKPVDLTGKAGRGTPDLTSNADPQTGYNVLVNGQQQVIGGTSSGAPMVAAFVGLASALEGVQFGDIHEQLYALGAAKTGFNDITVGDDGAKNTGYTAGPGWDAASGWGSIKGATLVPALAAKVATPAVRRPAAPGVAL